MCRGVELCKSVMTQNKINGNNIWIIANQIILEVIQAHTHARQDDNNKKVGNKL